MKIANSIAKINNNILQFFQTINLQFDTVDKVLDETDKAKIKSKDSFDRVYQILISAKSKIKGTYPALPKPITNNKRDIYKWIISETDRIKLTYTQSILSYMKNEGEKGKSTEEILFKKNLTLEDKKKPAKDFFNDELSNNFLFELFVLYPRYEKLYEYNFDEKDKKRIQESIDFFNNLSSPLTNKEKAESFAKKDQLLAAYYTRESLKDLFNYLFSHTIIRGK